MKVTAQSKLHYRIQHIIFILLLLACIGFAGWLSNEYNMRSDWTQGKRHSLSKETIELISQLEHPVIVRSYQSDDPILNKAVTEILQRYQARKDDFTFELVNPDIFIQQAKQDKIEQYGQTIVEYNGQKERINKLTEEAISNALLRLQRGNTSRLLFLTQHGERSPADNSAIGYQLLAQQLGKQGFKVETLNLLQQASITTENSTLVMSSIHQPLLDGEVEKILTFIRSGGNLLWLQDPGYHSTQKPLTEELQIDLLHGVIVDNNEEISRMLKLSHPAIIPILEYKLHPITEKMQYYTLFTTATAIIPHSDSKWIASDLLISSQTSWSETSDLSLGLKFDQGEDIPGPMSIGIAQQRQSKDKDKLIAQRAVIIGDTDFLSNGNLGHGANLDFIVRALNWLSQDDKLINISPKSAPDLQLNLSASSASIIGIFFLLVLPLLFFACGGFIWHHRRKQ